MESVPSTGGVIDLASPEDAVALHQMRLKTERWLAERNIEQWGEGFVSYADIAAQVDEQQWFVCRGAEGIVAALRYLTSDPDVWPDEPGAARYVHGLMADRDVAPPGAGAAILRWAETRAADDGVALMRLDCVESNGALRRFYRDQGYREVGRRDFDGPWFSATLLEKSLR